MTPLNSQFTEVCLQMALITLSWKPTDGKIYTTFTTTFLLLGSIVTSCMVIDKLNKAHKTAGIGKNELAIAAIGITNILGCNFWRFGNR